jgi:hypothetical protein
LPCPRYHTGNHWLQIQCSPHSAKKTDKENQNTIFFNLFIQSFIVKWWWLYNCSLPPRRKQQQQQQNNPFTSIKPFFKGNANICYNYVLLKNELCSTCYYKCCCSLQRPNKYLIQFLLNSKQEWYSVTLVIIHPLIHDKKFNSCFRFCNYTSVLLLENGQLYFWLWTLLLSTKSSW